MTRMTTAFAICALVLAGSAAAQTPPPTTPPPTQNPPPATQQAPPPAGQKPPAIAPTAKPVVPFPADAKIGFIDMQRLVNESAPGKRGQAAMKTLVDRLSSELATKNKEIQALQDKMKTQQNVVSEAVYNAMVRDLERKNREAQTMSESAQIERDQLQADLIQEFSQKVQPIVEAVRNERGLWAVWVLSSESGIYAVHTGLDLTADVLKRLDTIK